MEGSDLEIIIGTVQIGPENADDGLFVGSKHVTPGEKVKQLAIVKKVRE